MIETLLFKLILIIFFYFLKDSNERISLNYRKQYKENVYVQ